MKHILRKKRQNCTQLLHINPIKIYARKLKKNLWDESKNHFSLYLIFFFFFSGPSLRPWFPLVNFVRKHNRRINCFRWTSYKVYDIYRLTGLAQIGLTLTLPPISGLTGFRQKALIEHYAIISTRVSIKHLHLHIFTLHLPFPCQK